MNDDDARAFIQQFGSRVRELRRQRGYTQADLGQIAGLDPTYLSGIEQGRRNPTLDWLVRLAQGLGVPLGDLFETQRCEQ